MVSLHVKYYIHGRIEGKKAVGVFTGFCDKYIWFAYTYIASDTVKNSTYWYGRIALSLKKNLGNHWGCCCLAMGSGNINSNSVVIHKLSKELGSCKERNIPVLCLCKLRIALRDGSCVYNNIYIICDIICCLWICNNSSFTCKFICKRWWVIIWTSNCKFSPQKNMGKTAHAYAAYSYKMYMNWIIKINVIHLYIPVFLIWLTLGAKDFLPPRWCLRIAALLRNSRNSANIRNPLIYYVNRYFLMFGGSQVQMPYHASMNGILTFWP